MSFHKIRTVIASLMFVAFVLGATTSNAEEAKVPMTVAEHEAMAKKYREQATQYKQVADEHRAMAAVYAEKHGPFNGTPPTPNPLTVKMKKHCETIAKDADKLAADATKAADYHEMRAKELQGK